jgi:hypothetical protein
VREKQRMIDTEREERGRGGGRERERGMKNKSESMGRNNELSDRRKMFRNCSR